MTGTTTAESRIRPASDRSTQQSNGSNLAINRVHQGDCIELMEQIEAGSVDLAFADPPFNIGYTYDVYDDKRSADEYLEWSQRWIAQIARILKDDGTFWLAIGDEFAAELKLIAQREAGFHCKSWVIWYYTFGVNCKHGFSRSHTHLFHFVKDRGQSTFNADNPAVRIPSARQLVYGDARANPKGRLPDNTWILRPQDLPHGFRPEHDVWYFPRVAGTFKEREGFHGCQMPEQLLGRIIRLCSNPGDLVFDPFTGSGTTLVTSKKLGRRWLGTELSSDYAQHVEKRLKTANSGDPLDGVADPLKSAPNTAAGTSLKARKSRKPTSSGDAQTMAAIIEAYSAAHEGLPLDHLLARPDANGRFVAKCRELKIPGDASTWNHHLLTLRKSGKLPKSEQRVGSPFTNDQIDCCSYGAEVAWQFVSAEFNASLDQVLSHPAMAAVFDELAERLAPGYDPFRYRWAALQLRKRARSAKRVAEERFSDAAHSKLPRLHAIDSMLKKWEEVGGVYVLVNADRQPLYVGETLNLARRLQATRDNAFWRELGVDRMRIFENDAHTAGLQAALIQRLNPLLNRPCE